MGLRRVAATRYVTPLREGGSMPAIVEADDSGTYVLKFRGAGQGPKALVAEIIAGEIARALGLPVPSLVLMRLDPLLGRNEPDYEIRSLLQKSSGLNLGVDYLPGSLAFEPGISLVSPSLAAQVVWFDALVANVDRTARNTNLLWWHKQLYLIDHGAALIFHHEWHHEWTAEETVVAAEDQTKARQPFSRIRDHVLLPMAGDVLEADRELAPRLTEAILRDIVALVPTEWLDGESLRERYVRHFVERLTGPRTFAEDAEHARTAHV